MNEKRTQLTNFLLAILIAVVGYGIVANQRAEIVDLEVRGYQDRSVILAAGDPLPITGTIAEILEVVGVDATGQGDVPITLDSEVVDVDATGQGDVPITWDSEPIPTGDNYIGRVNISESVTLVVTDSDGNLGVRQGTRGALTAEATNWIRLRRTWTR